MNRRAFLSSLGAALGSLAIATRLAQAELRIPPRIVIADYLTDSDAWFIKTEPHGLKWFYPSSELPCLAGIRHSEGWTA